MPAWAAVRGLQPLSKGRSTSGDVEGNDMENKIGRYISKEEAHEVLKRNEVAGLVMQPFNSQKVGGMCS
jgi:hypothetical protein